MNASFNSIRRRLASGKSDRRRGAKGGGMLSTIEGAEKIRDELFRIHDGCYLLGVKKNRDPGDLARCARGSATSSADNMPPTAVVDGSNRVVGEDRSAWLPQGEDSHRIEFGWNRPRQLNVDHLTFELRGARTRVEALEDEGWTEVGVAGHAASRGYPSRRHVVVLAPVRTRTVRFTLAEPVAVCEILLYNEPEAVHRAISERSARPPLTEQASNRQE